MLEENRSWLAPSALDADGNLVLCFQSYIVKTPRHTILVDSCIGNDKERTARPLWHQKKDDALMRGLAAAGLTVNDIDFVMCTHLHVDHVGWNTKLENGRWVPTFPKARYLFSKTELDYWLAENDKTALPPIVDSVIPIVEAKRCDLVTSDHALDDTVCLLPTPGHTIDHYAVALGRGGKDAVITGDLIHTPLQARYTELSMRVDYDPKQSAPIRGASSWRATATPARCAASRTSRRRRAATSSAGARASAATTSPTDAACGCSPGTSARAADHGSPASWPRSRAMMPMC